MRINNINSHAPMPLPYPTPNREQDKSDPTKKHCSNYIPQRSVPAVYYDNSGILHQEVLGEKLDHTVHMFCSDKYDTSLTIKKYGIQYILTVCFTMNASPTHYKAIGTLEEARKYAARTLRILRRVL